MLYKRGQGITVGTLVLIVLGIIVLTFLVYGFSIGWGNLFSKVTNFGGSNIDTVRSACEIACSTELEYAFCNTEREIQYGDGRTDKKTCHTLGIDCNKISCREREIETTLSPAVEESLRYFNLDMLDTTEDLELSDNLVADLESQKKGLAITAKQIINQKNLENRGFTIAAFGSSTLSREGNDYLRIIIVEDIHNLNHFEKDIPLLTKLKNDFGIKLFGLEGWAGYEFDQQKNSEGYRAPLFGGEVGLVATLAYGERLDELKLELFTSQEAAKSTKAHMRQAYNEFKGDDEILIIGLEDGDIYMWMYKFIIIKSLFNTHIIMKQLGVTTLPQLEKESKETYDIVMPFYSTAIDSMFIMGYDVGAGLDDSTRQVMEEVKTKVGGFNFLFLFKKIAVNIMEKIPQEIENSLRKYLVSRDYSETEISNAIKDMEKRSPHQIIMNKRNKYAVKKFLEELRKRNLHEGVIFFGQGHTEGLVAEFREQLGKDDMGNYKLDKVEENIGIWVIKVPQSELDEIMEGM